LFVIPQHLLFVIPQHLLFVIPQHLLFVIPQHLCLSFRSIFCLSFRSTFVCHSAAERRNLLFFIQQWDTPLRKRLYHLISKKSSCPDKRCSRKNA